MQIEFPRLADTLVEGTVSAWYKQPGDRVVRGEPLFAVETDKINTDVESPFDGVLAEIVVPAGTLAEVGQVLAHFASDVGSPAIGNAPHVSPVGEHTAMSRPVAAPGPSANGGLSPMRKRIAERMVESRATIAQGSCARRVALGGIDRRGRSWNAFFIKALAQALEADRIGLAVAIPGGLIVPVIADARTASLDTISLRIGELAMRARDGSLAVGDVGNAAATVTNVGATGTLMAFPLLAPGEPVILAPGAIVDGMCWLSMCYERAVYDEYAADALLGSVVTHLGAQR